MSEEPARPSELGAPEAASREPEGAAAPAIRIQGLVKAFGGLRVLDGIDLDVAPGTVFGYIGPNGAGKSTTVKILTCLLDAFEGSAWVTGIDVRGDPLEVKRRIGYVPENAQLYEPLTVGEHLLLVGRLHGLPDALTEHRAEELLGAFGLPGRRSSRLSSLSKGMRQKVLIVSALLHDPQVLFLDEPLSGLDVASTILVKELIRTLADQGRTIFYCSHMMDVVERVCDRIAILSGGRIVADGSYQQLAADREGGSLESIFSELTGAGGERTAVARIVGALDDGAA